MKLSEAVQLRQPLFEDSQFKDFKTIVKEEISDMNVNLKDSLEQMFFKMQNALGDDTYEFGSPIGKNPNFFISLTKKVTQHELRSYDLTDVMRGTKEFSHLSRIDAYAMKLTEAMIAIAKKADDPARKEAEYEIVDSGSGYQILQLYNYSAARMICNKYNLNHCIGSGNASWFKAYGEKKGRDTYYIITDAGRAVAVHSGGSNPYIITSHDNDHELKDGKETRGSNVKRTIINDVNSSVSLENVPDVISRAFPSSKREDIKSLFQGVIDAMRATSDKSIAQLYNTLNGSLHAVEENNTPGFMLQLEDKKSTRVFILPLDDDLKSYNVYIDGGPRETMDMEATKSIIVDMLNIPSEVDLYATAGVAERKGLPDHKNMLLTMVGLMQ